MQIRIVDAARALGIDLTQVRPAWDRLLQAHREQVRLPEPVDPHQVYNLRSDALLLREQNPGRAAQVSKRLHAAISRNSQIEADRAAASLRVQEAAVAASDATRALLLGMLEKIGTEMNDAAAEVGPACVEKPALLPTKISELFKSVPCIEALLDHPDLSQPAESLARMPYRSVFDFVDPVFRNAVVARCGATRAE